MHNEDLKEDDIYNMDETSLQPRGGWWVDGSKMGKDHVTVAFCANSTGTHKLPLLFFTDMPVREHLNFFSSVILKIV